MAHSLEQRFAEEQTQMDEGSQGAAAEGSEPRPFER
jgi:hypothetical protein